MNRRKTVATVLFAILILILVALIAIWTHFGQREKRYECTNYAMGTYIQQTVYGKKAQEAAKEAAAKIQELEDLISWRKNDSDIGRLNQAAGTKPAVIHEKTAALLRTSLEIAQKSDGAYDPTILPISDLWGFESDNPCVPDSKDIQKFLPDVNYKDLQVSTGSSGSTALLKRAMMGIDLGGIGKGAACDEAVAAYRSAGAECGIISAGGSSLGLFGTKADGTPWKIAIRDPNSSDNSVTEMAELNLDSGFVSTSGVYEKKFTQNGITYHHLLNPKTGYPENNGLVSVTVVTPNGALSDGLSTACFVLGLEKGEALLKQYQCEGVFIDRARNVYVTAGLKSRLKIINSKYIVNS
ncbi:MAG: FAD:protein FMN transferase [Oscillospiraceae bacterium]|jgi:thiamine biosynthesis lipoprotein|nr:FAD:protein FMN transferase [Oscillospiraceae bacterium]